MKQISEIVDLAKGGQNGAIAVAAAHDEDVVRACINAFDSEITRPIFIGRGKEIEAIISSLGRKAADFEIIDSADDSTSAASAVEQVREGRAGFIMKGLMSTSAIMREVVSKDSGLRTGRLLSHCMLYEVPGFGRIINNTDGGMNTYPDLEKKIGILENAAITMKALGYNEINAAVICGAETVDPKIQATVDAAEIAAMGDKWGRYNMNVYGPVGLDLAVSVEACRHKNYTAKGGGRADIILVPTYEVGNGIGKAMTYFANAKSAGIVVGAKVPIVLVSRADTAETKLSSIAFGALAAKAEF